MRAARRWPPRSECPGAASRAGRRGHAEDPAARAAGEAVRARHDQRARRAPEHRHEVDASRSAAARYPARISWPTIHSTSMLQPMCTSPKCTSGIGEQPPPLARLQVRPGSPRSRRGLPVAVDVVVAQRDERRTPHVTAIDQLGCHQWIASASSGGCAPCPSGAAAPDALEALRSDRGLDEAVGTRRAARTGCMPGPSPGRDGGSTSPWRPQP